MLRTALAIFVVGSMSAWGQAPNDTSGRTDKAQKVDRAAAYYHYTLACFYARMDGDSGGTNAEYSKKAIENHKLAVKADPRTPKHMPPRYVISPLPLLAPRRGADPSPK